jgi:hypothetical protein
LPNIATTVRETAGVVFVADDLAAWLIFVLAEGGRKKLTSLIFGDDPERALRPAATAAVQLTAAELCPGDAKRAEEFAIMVGPLFETPLPGASLGEQATVLEALQAAIAGQLKLLDDPGLTAMLRSLTGMRDVSATVVAQKLTAHLVREIVTRGSRGGPLEPLANQLNHDATHLQGQRIEGALAQLADQVTALASVGGVMPGKPVRLLPRPAFLAGREDLLADLDARLTGGDGDGPRIVALHGLAGVGKTSVALEYAHRHLAGLGLVWQFPAEEATALVTGFAELAAQLGARDVADTRDPVLLVHGVLAAREGDWLLIFDNASDLVSVQAFLPPAGPGQVLITSQNPNWPHGQALGVPPLNVGVAADFLVKRTGDQDRQAAQELASELDGLPLALEQAAAYILTTGITLAGYLSLFQERRADLLARGEAPGHPVDLAATLRLTLSRLEGEAPAAAGVLRLLACLAAEPVPLALLLSNAKAADKLDPGVAAVMGPSLGDAVAAGDAITALRRYSLATPAGNRLVLVHRLVQVITLSQEPADAANRWMQAAAALVEAAIPADTELPATWPLCAVLLPHALTVLDLTSDGIWRIAQYLGNSGSYPAARDLFRLIVDAHEKSDAYGPEHPETLAARAEVARWTGQAGDATGARDQYVALLPLRERVSGPEHAETLNARQQLATWTGGAGDAAGARDQFAALLPVREQVSGPEDTATLNARHELATWTGRAGDAAGARDQFAALLPILEQVLGPEHPSTLTTRNNLADMIGEAGDAAGARDQYASLLPVRERVSGPEHPSTLIVRSNLAGWTGRAGDAAGARDQLATLLPVRERVSGPEHPSTLIVRNNLAGWIGEAGDAAGARDQLAALLLVVERVLGPEHPQTVSTRNNLATWTRKAEGGTEPDRN